MIWKGIEREVREERKEIIMKLVRNVIRETRGIRRIKEREGERGKKIAIVEMENEKNKDEILIKKANL